MSFTTDTIIPDLLTRVAAIQMLVTGVKRTSTNIFELINAPYPAFYNYIRSITPNYGYGALERLDIIEVMMRLVAGPFTSGEAHEREMFLNKAMMGVINLFDYRPFLQDPTTGEAFQWIAPEGCQVIQALRIQKLEVGAASADLLGNEYVLRVPLQMSIGRLS